MIVFLVQVVFEGVRGKDYQGDIALDDIVIKNGLCPPLKECTFEDTNLCGWKDEKRYFYCIFHCVHHVQLNKNSFKIKEA